MAIHPTAVVDPSAKIPASCSIGPYAVIGANVEMGENCEVMSHASVLGPTKMGSGNRIFSFAAIGGEPQDFTYKGEPTTLEIGNNNLFREYVTVNRGTLKGGGVTKIGNNCLIMAYSHIAHDCILGDYVVAANGATLAGHVIVESHAVLGAMGPIHQFCKVGEYAYIGGGTVITQDVLPYSKTSARREVNAFGVNAIGLERKGFDKEAIKKIQHAYKVLLTSKLNTSQALERIKGEGEMSPEVKKLVEFIETSERGVIK